MTKTYQVRQGQSIFDVALQLYGDAAMALKLMADNPDLVPSLQHPVAGASLSYDDAVTTRLTVYMSTNRIEPTTAAIDPQAQRQQRSFDASFDQSFG